MTKVEVGGGPRRAWGHRHVNKLLDDKIHVITGLFAESHGIAAGVANSIQRSQSKRSKLSAEFVNRLRNQCY